MSSPLSQQLVLVLGATGLIGQSVTAALSRHGYRVRGLARCASSITRAQKHVEWLFENLTDMQSASRWQPVISDCAAIVNVAGALQDTDRGDLQAVHLGAIAALVDACGQLGGKRRLVHISAPGVDAEASTAFYRTKAAGDRAVRQGALDWVILRPALVIAPHAYGASALLRALASFPLVIPVVHANSPVQTTAVDDVAQAVCMAVDDRIPAVTDVVLADAAAVTLIGAGVTPIPAKVAVIIGALADIGVGLACLHRRTHKRALYGMIGLTLLCLLAATYFTPALWADPFGSLVKAIPAAVLALVALAISPER